MNDHSLEGALLGFVIGVLAVLLFMSGGDDYRRGQIDALSGKVKYELVEQENGERVWQEKEEQNK